MNLNEYQAKNVLRELGFTIPRGVKCDSPEMAEALAGTLETERWVIKALILAGGRARGHFEAAPQEPGGVRFANSIDEIVQHSRQMIGGKLITRQTGAAGEVVTDVYLERLCEVEREHYLALTVDPDQGQLVFIVSREGGSNIEEQAAEKPDSVQRFEVALDQPFTEAREVAAALGLNEAHTETLIPCLENMVSQFAEKDMLLIEINPLAVTDTDELVALDATVVFDDNALFRQGHPEQMDAYTHLSEQEYNAAVQGLNLVKLQGNIATLSAGAGLAMATIDAICENGGAPANFLDVPPSTAVAKLQNAVTLLLSDNSVACLLVNVFGGGIMRCDAVADALLLANRETPFSIPVVVRLAGTNAELGQQRLTASIPEVILASDLASAARICCEHTASLPAQSSRSLSSDSEHTAAEHQDSTGGLWKSIRRLIPDKHNDRS